MAVSRRRIFYIVAVLASLGLLSHLYFLGHTRGVNVFSHYFQEGDIPASAFNFSAPRPAWLAKPTEKQAPLVLRIAFVTHPGEKDRRDAIREHVLKGVPSTEVVFDHRFFIGSSGDSDLDARIAAEATERGDIEKLNLTESKDHLSRKRYAALLWGASTAQEPYDYFMTADSDSFLRLAALARRLRGIRPDLDPRRDRISWGHTLSHWWHWHPDQNEPDNAEVDLHYEGDWYHYPAGIMYLFSYPLITALYERADKLPHRVPYPYDDVVLGSWVYELGPAVESDVPWYDASGARAAELDKDKEGNSITLLTTHVVNDSPGAHDPPDHGFDTNPIDWDIVCIHHVSAIEMRGLRRIPQWQDEWDSNIDYELDA